MKNALADYLTVCARLVRRDDDDDVTAHELDALWTKLTPRERAATSVIIGAVRDQEHADHRAALVRMVVAEQWREAFVLLFMSDWVQDRDGNRVWCTPTDLEAVRFEFPCAVDVVAERLGER